MTDPVASTSTTPPAAPPAPSPAPTGRRYGFLCGYCSSRLEATENMAGQTGTCPTCGNGIIIPILDSRGRLIDPTSGQIIKQNPHPVHAYAAAGHRAPQIVPAANPDERSILCPRCGRLNPIAGNNCLGCQLPFTLEGSMGDAISGTNTWAVASLVLGIVGVPSFPCLAIPSILAIIFGSIALRDASQNSRPQSGQGMATAGIILGGIGVTLFALFAAHWAHMI